MQNILLNSTICQLVQRFIWVTRKTKQSCAAFPDAQPKKGLKCSPHINQNTLTFYGFCSRTVKTTYSILCLKKINLTSLQHYQLLSLNSESWPSGYKLKAEHAWMP